MKIVIIGAGNIATHYAKVFHSLGHQICEIYNRSSANAQALADAFSSQVIYQLNQITRSADLYIIAVNDSSINNIIDQLSQDVSGIVVHTSGATPITVLNKFNKYGVIYPPQSLNKNIKVSYSDIPFAIEGNTIETQNILLELGKTLSPKAFVCNSKQRLALHVSAVFANNFTNALFGIAYDILNKEKLDFELIKPIILETAQKVQNSLPNHVQTGPASRNDKITINTHLDFLSDSKDLSEIYQTLSDFIINSRPK